MAKEYSAKVGDVERQLVVEPTDDGRWRVVLDGVERIVDARRTEGGPWSILVDGRVAVVDVEPNKDGDLVVELGGATATVKLVDPRRRRLEQAREVARKARGAGDGPEDVRAPMPGKVVKVMVKPGDRVTAGQGLVVIEAMKMENEIRAARDAGVKAVHVAEGQPIEGQQPVVTLE